MKLSGKVLNNFIKSCMSLKECLNNCVFNWSQSTDMSSVSNECGDLFTNCYNLTDCLNNCTFYCKNVKFNKLFVFSVKLRNVFNNCKFIISGRLEFDSTLSSSMAIGNCFNNCQFFEQKRGSVVSFCSLGGSSKYCKYTDINKMFNNCVFGVSVISFNNLFEKITCDTYFEYCIRSMHTVIRGDELLKVI